MTNTITNHKLIKSKKFAICIHQASKNMIDIERSENRFTYYTFLEYGDALLYILNEENTRCIRLNEEKKLYDFREFVNNDVVGKALENTKVISFNPWRLNEKWDGKLITESGEVFSTQNYSALICLEGEFEVNGHKFTQYDYAELTKDKKYNIEIPSGTYAALFELVEEPLQE